VAGANAAVAAMLLWGLTDGRLDLSLLLLLQALSA
jgi:hypothetical protein